MARTRTRTLIDRGCGIDIDARKLWATRFITTRREYTDWETEVFDNAPAGVVKLVQWLEEKQITHVAFESTGIYWELLYSFLEPSFTLIMANPRQIKQLKGKKTDMKDSEHIARLLQMNAINASFVPPKNIREARDLCRMYQTLTEDRSRYKNRIIKTLRQAGITIDSCMSDVFGKSGRAILEALIAGGSAEDAAKCAKGKLKSRIPELVEAVRYPLTAHHRQVLARYYRLFEGLDSEISALDTEIDEKMAPYRKEIRRVDTLTGVGPIVARGVISEIGVDMSAFPSAKNLTSWAKVCPGNSSSAGKRKGGKNSKGNRYIRAYLGEAALAASRTRGSEFRSLYLRRAPRLGKTKALVSIQHKMLRVIHTMLVRGVDYCKTYEFDHRSDRRFALVRLTVRQISNEDLVRELLARGAKHVVWTWEYDGDQVAVPIASA